jgi:phage-related protein
MTKKKKTQKCSNPSASQSQVTKNVVFINTQAKKDFKDLSDIEKTGFSHQIETLIANGCTPTLSITHLPDDAIELKMNGRPAYRCIYYNKRPNEVVIVHTFKKTTNGVDRKNLETTALRLKKMDPTQFC